MAASHERSDRSQTPRIIINSPNKRRDNERFFLIRGSNMAHDATFVAGIRQVRDDVLGLICDGNMLRSALMLFACALDAVFELPPIVRQLFGHFVGSARRAEGSGRHSR